MSREHSHPKSRLVKQVSWHQSWHRFHCNILLPLLTVEILIVILKDKSEAEDCHLELIRNCLVCTYLCVFHCVIRSWRILFCSTQHFSRCLKNAFLDSSVGEDSACNAGDSSSIPGLGRSAGEGIGYPLQYSWASPVTQVVKNPPGMWETWDQSLDWEDSLEKGKATHSSVLAWRISWTV